MIVLAVSALIVSTLVGLGRPLSQTMVPTCVWAGGGLPTLDTPAHSRMAPTAMVSVFSPRTGQWSQTLFAQVLPDSEFLYKDQLYRVTCDGTVEVVSGVTRTQLSEADRVYNKPDCRFPEANDAVMVLDKGMAFVRHAALGSLQPDQCICFQGKVYALHPGQQPGTMAVADTGIVASCVARSFERQADELINLRVRSSSGKESVLSGTLEHPFYVPGVATYVPMKELTAGAIFQTTDGATISAVGNSRKHSTAVVYNFEVENQHNYYIASKDKFGWILVHNTDCGVGGPYGHLKSNHKVEPGRDYAPGQKKKILDANRERNGGVLRDDETGEILSEPTQNMAGVESDPMIAQVDHYIPKKHGGPNSYANARVRAATHNNAKGATMP
ncbi:MAG: hypothetical protein BWY76_00605 [bacterium ADurb.Bin429]|nr:MAG: hypothetical protein BWY76_00605 [bacterium ADurb.Bin429]